MWRGVNRVLQDEKKREEIYIFDVNFATASHIQRVPWFADFVY